ncbi:MAG: indole-3-acetate monooxygenase [Miltoncostaeaceae bacterium]|jgi:alkylation response protein AidB-like acyl-CoA dehydrogenase|nr:indole-3-acetate monooxygenase [Miltoncostaeaceae bacterium]
MSTSAVDLLERVEAIGPVLREHAGEAERERRLARPALEAMRDAGLFRLLLPRSLGGAETDPVTFARIAEAVARHDSAAGWALQAGNTGAWWGCRFPDEGIEEIFADPDTLIAAAFHPPVDAVPVEGGFRVTGRRPLASTIRDSRWLLVTAVFEGGAVATLVGADEAGVVDSWYPLGMRGTDSNDVVLEDVFVPARRTFPLMPDFTPGSHYGGPLYRLPALTSVVIVLAPTALAIASEAVEAVRALAPGKRSLGTMHTLAERPVAHLRLGRAEGLIRGGRALLHQALGDAYELAAAGRPFTPEDRASVLLAGAHAVAASAEAVDLLYGISGSSAIYARSPIERHFRDVNTIRHHGFVNESRFEAVGQVMLGLAPEFDLLHF